jgi:hypothetical protein
MSKEKCRKNMSRVARSINVFRKSLKEQEAKNKALRDQITPMWGDKSKDGVVKDLSTTLAVGRSNVRAYQTALHELKVNLKAYNFEYDCLVGAEETEMVCAACHMTRQPQIAS